MFSFMFDYTIILLYEMVEHESLSSGPKKDASGGFGVLSPYCKPIIWFIAWVELIFPHGRCS